MSDQLPNTESVAVTNRAIAWEITQSIKSISDSHQDKVVKLTNTYIEVLRAIESWGSVEVNEQGEIQYVEDSGSPNRAFVQAPVK